MIKGVIFDIDGVLLDSMIIWTDLGERYLKSIGKEPEEGLTEKLFSMSMEQGAEYLKDKYNIDESVPEILDDINNISKNFYYKLLTCHFCKHQFFVFLVKYNEHYFYSQS